MNRISIISIILLICSCGTSKKITQTETHSKVNIECSFVDTSKKSESWEMIVNSVAKTIDLSKIKITTFYPEKDSLGEQFIKDIIQIDNDITNIESIIRKELLIKNEENGIFLKNNKSEEDKTFTSTIFKKSNIPVNLKLIIIVVSFLAFITIYLKFKNIIHTKIKKLL